MPRINLLPWREQQRKERKLAFLVGLGATTVAAALAIGAAYIGYRSMIDSQHKRNDLLKAEISVLDRQIEEIRNLEAQKQHFIARMQVIEKLQRSRPEIVHVFDTVTRMLPDGIFLTDMTQTGKRFKFHGIAQSHTRVSSLMRNIEASEWLSKPELEVIERKKDNANVGSDFTLYAEQTVSAVDDIDEADKPKAAKGAARGKTTGAKP